jgi:hypothetical protein
MFGFVLDMFLGMPCPMCRRRGLFGVVNRVMCEGLEQDLMVNPRYSVARCRRCGARCIAARTENEDYREATDEEWQANAYDDLPAARVRPR